jgi:hypothetical protein
MSYECKHLFIQNAERINSLDSSRKRGRRRSRTGGIEKEGEWPGGKEGRAGPGWLVLCARVRVGM